MMVCVVGPKASSGEPPKCGDAHGKGVRDLR